MTNWIKWGIVSSGWVTLVSAVVLFGLGLSPMAWHASGYTLTLDLLQTAAVLIAVLAFVVVQTLGAISRLNEIAVGVERMAQDFLAATASAKRVADEITADSPHVAAEIASSYQSLTSYIQSDLLTRFGRRPWGPFRWQTNLITIASCGYLMVATACEAGLFTRDNSPTVVEIDWLHALYFLAAWAVCFIFTTQVCLQKVKSDEIALSTFGKELDAMNQELGNMKGHLTERRG